MSRKFIDEGCNASGIIERLYEQYFQGAPFSEQTSSHWKKYGEFQKVSKVDGAWVLVGIGFGDYAPRTWWRAIYYAPTYLFLYFLLRLSDRRILGAARDLARKVGRMFSYDVARMVLSAELLMRHTSGCDGKTVAIIGDGYGTLGALLKAIYPAVRIVYINLGRTLLYDVFYTALAYPRLDHKLIASPNSATSEDFNYIEAETVRQIVVCADLFINIASMQEMSADATASYFHIIRSQPGDTLFYCCNRIQKNLPDGTVTKFDEYGWLDSDETIIDELCPWHQIAPMNRPPFIYRFDGPTRHKLVKIRPWLEGKE